MMGALIYIAAVFLIAGFIGICVMVAKIIDREKVDPWKNEGE